MLGVLTGEVGGSLPRRYGYVPNTAFAMALVGFLAAPVIRRKLGKAPCLIGVGFVVWSWLSLVAVCLPIIRAQDGRVWKMASQALHHPSDEAVLFVNNWDNFDRPGYVIGVNTPGLRGPNFPEVFESPQSNYWWESLYSTSALGARFAAYRVDPVDANSVRLSGSGFDGPPLILPKASVVVVSAAAFDAPVFPRRVRPHVSTYQEFEQTIAAHRGADVEVGWSRFLNPPDPVDLQIDLGTLSQVAAGSVPDKAFESPGKVTALVGNYGSEGNAGGLFGPATGGPISYFLTNRNGNYTYRIDFTDATPKKVNLDILEMWHPERGIRLMNIDAAFDGRWFHVAQPFDPPALGFNIPVSLEFYPGNTHTLEVRLTQALGAKDVPFLNGIRISRITR